MATPWSKFKEEQSTVAQGEELSTKRRCYTTRPQKYKRPQQARNVPLAGQKRRGCGHGRWPRRPRDTSLLLLSFPKKSWSAGHSEEKRAGGGSVQLWGRRSGSPRKEEEDGFERLHDTKKAKWNGGRSVEAKMPLCSVAGDLKLES
ncbi:hypothetical protein E2320_000821 [Naja naja]|nr:hypothetical protein E2320_000821 [Naja naja]